MINGNDPAMPVQIENDVDVHNYGLTKREYFAGVAMQGLITACLESEKDATMPASSIVTASLAVRYADALLAALNAQK